MSAAALLGYATPSFWLGQLALLTLAVGTGLFPVQGMTDARQPPTGFGHTLDVLRHLAFERLPAKMLHPIELVRVDLQGLDLVHDLARSVVVELANELVRVPAEDLSAGRGTAGKLLSDGRVTHAYTLRDGLIERMEIY